MGCVSSILVGSKKIEPENPRLFYNLKESMRTFEKAEREISNGKLWRAREILQGSIPNIGYDCRLFEKLGVVLLKMGDLPEAGRFLFLSGQRAPEYEQAISLFLYKHRRNSPLELFHAFPRTARLATLESYPQNVGLELKRFGFPELLMVTYGEVRITSHKGRDVLGIAACLTIALIVLVLLLLGLMKLKEIVSSLFA